MKPRLISLARLPLTLAVAIAAMFPSAHAVSITWDADGATVGQVDGAGDWLTPGQWWDGANNVDWTSGDDAVFGNAGAGDAVTLSGPTTVNSLTLDTFTDTYTLGTAGQTITLNNGIIMNAGAGAANIISPITLSADQSWLNNSSNLLSVGTGAVDNGGFLLTVSGSGDTTVLSAIGGAGGFTKINAGLATLGAIDSTYTGATTVGGGILSIASVADAGNNSSIGAFPTAGATGLFLNGGTLDYTGATLSTNRGFTVSANSAINVATENAKLTMGNFTMTGTNTLLTVNGGFGSTLDLGTFNHNTAQNQNITTNIPVSIASIAATVNQGILHSGSALMTIGNISATGNHFLGGGQILITGTVGITGIFTNNQTSGTITYTGTSFTSSQFRLFNGNTFVVGGSSTLGGGSYNGAITFVGSSRLQYGSSSNQTLSGNIGFLTTNGGRLTVSGSGTLTLTGTNTLIGLTTVSNGTLKYGRQTSLFNNLTANWIPANINVQNGGTLAFNVGGTNEFTTGSVTTLLTQLADSSGATNGMNAGSRFGFDTTNAAGGTFTIADVIANSTGASGGARGLTKLGTGSLVLTNSNTYTGDTLVSAGTLELADNAQLKFVLGATSGSNNSLTGAGTATLNGDFVIDTSAADALASGSWTLENVSTLTGGVYGTGFQVFQTDGTTPWTAVGSDTWTKVNGAKTYTFDETTGILTLAATPSGSPYDTWALGPFANPFTSTLPGVDFDNDGLDNLLEFVLGGDPTISQAGIVPTASTSGGNLVLTFKRSDASELAPAVAVTVELSTDLTFSTPAEEITIGPATDPGPIPPSGASYTVSNSSGFDTIIVSIPQGAAPKKFARVKAVQP